MPSYPTAISSCQPIIVPTSPIVPHLGNNFQSIHIHRLFPPHRAPFSHSNLAISSSTRARLVPPRLGEHHLPTLASKSLKQIHNRSQVEPICLHLMPIHLADKFNGFFKSSFLKSWLYCRELSHCTYGPNTQWFWWAGEVGLRFTSEISYKIAGNFSKPHSHFLESLLPLWKSFPTVRLCSEATSGASGIRFLCCFFFFSLPFPQGLGRFLEAKD